MSCFFFQDRCSYSNGNTINTPLLLPPPVPVLAQTVSVIYIDPDGKEKEVQAEVGKHLLDVAHDNNIELEGTNVT
jgi:hypothetical protein